MRESSSYIFGWFCVYTSALDNIGAEALSHLLKPEPEFVNLIKCPGIDSQLVEIDSLESIPGLLKRLQFRALIKLLLLNVKKKKTDHLYERLFLIFSKSHLWGGGG